MLLELNIRNIALIESLTIEFGRGFNVLTGETGTGKSIVVDSLNLALGGRTDRELIRTGAEKASVQAVFDIAGNFRAIEFARELGAEIDDGIVGVSREIRVNGRNICRISGVVVPLMTLRQFTSMLVDIHGQHEHQALIDPERHREFLDAFGGEEHIVTLNEAASLHAERSKIASEYRRITSQNAERERMIDMLEFQTSEINALRLRRGEEEKLERRAKFYENAEKIKGAVEGAYAMVYGGDSRMQGAQEQLDTAARSLEGVAKLDERIEKIAGRVKDSFYTVQDIGYELRSLTESLDYDPATADKVYDRLDKIRKLERKYGATLDEVMDFGEDAMKRLDELRRSDESGEELKAKYNRVDGKLKEVCAKLTASRKEIAGQLAEDVHEQLSDLGMARTQFKVRVDPAKCSATGMDDVEFMISTNPGEPLKSIGAVASGGELSRIMLALKAVAMDAGSIDSMVFDEIDTGVSGRMAQVVGEKMKLIAGSHQVLCVTHLPQIAAQGNVHFVVEKNVIGDRTGTTVRRLDDEGRILEISRLIGDGDDSDTSIRHAKHLLGIE